MSNSQDKTEKATPQKIRKAKEDGQIARSKDILSAILIIGCFFYLKTNIHNINIQIQNLIQYNFDFSYQSLNAGGNLVNHFGESIFLLIKILSPLFLFLLVLIIICGTLPGGLVFNFKNCGFKFKRINPIAGIKRMFSSNTLMELFKSILKISLLLFIGFSYLNNNFFELMSISEYPTTKAIESSVIFICTGVIYLGYGLVLIAVIDSPYQLWKFYKDLRMSKQEIKDEYKQNEGKPEIKAKVRQIQQRMARSRAEVSVPTADALIVNPEHYAVAIKYDAARADAPFVIAKGIDNLALYMKDIARKNDIEILELPPLARSIYYSTQIDQQIPSGLYLAVAQVLQYILLIKEAKSKGKRKPFSNFNFKIPKHLRK